MQDETEFILTIIITISLLQKDNHKIIIFFLKQNRPQQLYLHIQCNTEKSQIRIHLHIH